MDEEADMRLVGVSNKDEEDTVGWGPMATP